MNSEAKVDVDADADDAAIPARSRDPRILVKVAAADLEIYEAIVEDAVEFCVSRMRWAARTLKSRVWPGYHSGGPMPMITRLLQDLGNLKIHLSLKTVGAAALSRSGDGETKPALDKRARRQVTKRLIEAERVLRAIVETLLLRARLGGQGNSMQSATRRA
eukprot:TRINITY_DN101997_c0_g1_i1.p1 TRINITY_DN101997_c0_g1~~TRINITY_DN101997_c0_g1_i1.p1  ORF type:complete len:161 (-),score=28.57 TRINITY_DN101997_c0_g1_i1:280-762(-)